MRPILVPHFIEIHNKPKEWFIANAHLIKSGIEKLNEGVPLVSIIIPAYNEEENLGKTLSSLSKTISDYSIEVIVVDNNSSDNSSTLIQSLGAVYVFEGKQGVTNARNAGLKAAKGKYVLSADADTIYSPYWVNHLVKPLEANERVCLTYGKFSFLPEGGQKRVQVFGYECIGDMYKYIHGLIKDKAIYVHGVSSGFRKEQAQAVDGYAHPPGSNEDGYLGIKLRGRFGKLKKITHSDSYAWTSSRKLLLDKSLFSRLIHKVRRLFS